MWQRLATSMAAAIMRNHVIYRGFQNIGSSSSSHLQCSRRSSQTSRWQQQPPRQQHSLGTGDSMYSRVVKCMYGEQPQQNLTAVKSDSSADSGQLWQVH